MTNETKPTSVEEHGNYERRDIGVAGVLYFLAALLVAGVLVHFIVHGLYRYLDKRFESEQTPVSPLVTAPKYETRHLPLEYKTDSEGADYEKYLEKSFPQPQLELNERTELNKVRLREEDILNTYDWVDQKAGTVRIPIDRAMDLLVERGLPVRTEAPNAGSAATQQAKAQPSEKGTQR